MRALLFAAGLLSVAVPAIAQTPRPDPGPLTIARQGSFFVGGRDVKSDTLSTLPAYAASGTITVDQMYVHYQVPVGVLGVPITLIHGCCLTGKTWETTPDGRMGWDEYFVRHGHPTYVIDQVWRGRSAADPSAINAVRSGKAAVDQLPTVFSAGHEGAWAIFRFGKEYPANDARDALSARRASRVLEADGAGQPGQPPYSQPHRPGAIGVGAEARRHRADEPLAVRHLPVPDREPQPQRHRRHRLDRARRLPHADR
jgi:hypothetical protein